ncbi:Ribonuclease H-like superfamily [Arabidopsis suecica]|uniref:Ribonuclease H-like superfamily n=1 Tax=Arabidopsis suecica TaxID=45249 RepID=A0A8T2CIM5_ARASU|nr:Ribonuclease H-like superfamily [Arabidopsis suecica]
MAGEEDSSLSSSKPAVHRSAAAAVSPYTLASSDNPGAIISSVELNGDNYNQWKTEMMNALQAKRKTGFINGTIPRPPPDNPNFENWTAVNSMIVGWIRTSIEPKVKLFVTFLSDAHLLWVDLKQRFSVGNKVQVHQIKAQLASCRQYGQAVIEYYGRLSSMWEEYNIYKPVMVCICGLCRCGVTSEPSKERVEEKIHQFVLGLDESRFGGLCATLINMDPLPSLIEIYSRVSREEQRLSSVRLREQKDEAIGGRSVMEDVGRTVEVAVAVEDHMRILTQLVKEKSTNEATSNGNSDRFSGKVKFGDVILDTGASHHMTGTLSLLTNGVPIPPAVWTYLLLEKSEMHSVLTNFLQYAAKQFGKTVKIVRSDNGTEFMCLSSYFRENRIIHQTSCVVTPQQNGRVERKHRHILNVARAVLFRASLPIKFWGEPILTAAYLINRTPSSVLSGCTPYEVLHGLSNDDDWQIPSPVVRESNDSTASVLSSIDHNDALLSTTDHVDTPVLDSSNVAKEYVPEVTPPSSPTSDSSSDSSSPAAIALNQSPTPVPTTKLCQSQRPHNPPAKLNDYVLYNAMKVSYWMMYKTKYNADGSVERYKTRLVVQGNKQIKGEDYNKTFALVVKMTTVCTLLRLVADAYIALDNPISTTDDEVPKERMREAVSAYQKFRDVHQSDPIPNGVVNMGGQFIVKETIDTLERMIVRSIEKRSRDDPKFKETIFTIANNLYWCICKLTSRKYTPITNIENVVVIVTTTALSPVATTIILVRPQCFLEAIQNSRLWVVHTRSCFRTHGQSVVVFTVN